MFQSVLIANRGEIAVRIARTLRRMGVRSVVAASIPDRRSLAVREADGVALLLGYTASETYLDGAAIIQAARDHGCEAVHPGYGFLSENPEFAEACAAAGLVFIGPPPALLRSLGDKSSARALGSDVPVVPGWDGPDDAPTLTEEATRLGYPVILKARAGGGGRGMRIVQDPTELAEHVTSARREAESAFGDGRLFLEKLITDAHHVEVQVLADAQGNAIHLGERDCSVQRRHQKLIEETPSPVVDARLREQLTSAALRLVRTAGYVNAGTVEFLVGRPDANDSRPFFFLEVNPRLQVEHPVTEAVTGLDLVELQLRIAAGEPLPFAQKDVRFEGHAIEFRINAEDPWDSFKPGSGRIVDHNLSRSADRADLGFAPGDEVPAFYDSLIAKCIVHEPSREEAIARGREMLSDRYVAGVRTNIAFHSAVLDAPEFRAGHATTEWLGAHLDDVLAASPTPAPVLVAAAIAFTVAESRPLAPIFQQGVADCLYVADAAGAARAITLSRRDGTIVATLDGGEYQATLLGSSSPDQVGVRVGGHDGALNVCMANGRATVSVGTDQSRHYTAQLVAPPPLPRRQQAAAAGVTAVVAPLAGTVLEVRASPGDSVDAGQLMVVLEAMKMEHRIAASAAGTIQAAHVAPGDVVTEGQLLVELA